MSSSGMTIPFLRDWAAAKATDVADFGGRGLKLLAIGKHDENALRARSCGCSTGSTATPNSRRA